MVFRFSAQGRGGLMEKWCWWPCQGHFLSYGGFLKLIPVPHLQRLSRSSYHITAGLELIRRERRTRRLHLISGSRIMAYSPTHLATRRLRESLHRSRSRDAVARRYARCLHRHSPLVQTLFRRRRRPGLLEEDNRGLHSRSMRTAPSVEVHAHKGMRNMRTRSAADLPPSHTAINAHQGVEEEVASGGDAEFCSLALQVILMLFACGNHRNRYTRHCHSTVHHVATNDELARNFYTVELLLQREDIQKWKGYAAKQRFGFRWSQSRETTMDIGDDTTVV